MNKKSLEDSIVQLKGGKVSELAGVWSDFPDLDSIRESTAID